MKLYIVILLEPLRCISSYPHSTSQHQKQNYVTLKPTPKTSTNTEREVAISERQIIQCRILYQL